MNNNNLKRDFTRKTLQVLAAIGGLIVLAVLVWQGITASGNPDPSVPHIGTTAAVLDTAVLVFREGLETILVLSAIVASLTGARAALRGPVGIGAAAAFFASLITWFLVVGILSDLNHSIPALEIQAGTGLLAVIVLLVIMNWFFHKVYWTGWISMHGRRKRELLEDTVKSGSQTKLLLGFALLGFTSVYREGFEVVLFLQGLRLQVGSLIVGKGVALGLLFTGIIGVLTFFAHKRLPYRKMLVLTGILLGAVLLVMVGEEIQEMQLAHWISTTTLNLPIPAWMGVWFSIFPTLESLLAQAIAATLVVGSYFAASRSRRAD